MLTAARTVASEQSEADRQARVQPASGEVRDDIERNRRAAIRPGEQPKRSADGDVVQVVAGTTASFVPQYADATRILLDALAVTASARSDGALVFDPGTLRATVAATTLRDGVSGAVLFDAAGDRTSVILRQGGPSTEDPETLTLLVRSLGLTPCFIEDGAIVYFDAD